MKNNAVKVIIEDPNENVEESESEIENKKKIPIKSNPFTAT
jgi:hypothetical protein